MRRLYALLAIVGLLAAFAPKAQSEVYMDYDFPDGVVWRIGGFEVYDVVQRGEVVGEARIEYSQITMLDQPAYRLRWLESWTEGEEAAKTHEVEVDTKMAAGDLRAHMAMRIERIGEEEWRFEGNYTGENQTIGSYYPDDPERYEFSVARKSRFHDADILPFLLRNIPFEEGNFVTLSVLDISTQSFFTPIANVTGSEIVETSKTQYDCWTVNVSTVMGGFTAWYSKSDPHYLVRIRYPDRDIVLDHHS